VSVKYSNSTLKVSLAAISANYSILKKKAGDKEVAAVVKANAYGLGVGEVAAVLQNSGCNKFFVANLDEAIELRGILPEVLIGVFSGISKSEEDAFIHHRLTPVLNSMYQFELFAQYLDKKEKNFSCMLHIDSGMNRLGFSIYEIQKLQNDGFLKDLNIKMVLSHLACADEKSHEKNLQQLAVVKKLRDIFPNIPISFANSYGVFLGDEYHFDIIRPGIALYGGNLTPYASNPMQNVVQITSKILQIRNIDSAQTVGYGATCNLQAGSKIATLLVGYADGYFRSLSNKAYCAIGGKKVPVVGRVSMDLITIDITSIKDVAVGDEVEILGDTITLQDLATNAGTIDYEILTSLGGRYKRVYL
jgi:alanine racemase